MNGSTFDEGTSPGDVKNFNGKALLRVRDAKPNTDAEHRVPTGSRLYDQPNFFTAPLNKGDFQGLCIFVQPLSGSSFFFWPS